MKMGELLLGVMMVVVLGLLNTHEVYGQAIPNYDLLDSTGYESQVEYTTRDQEKSHTFFVDEYHDIDSRRGRLEIDYFDRSSVYYFSNMNEAVTITYEGRPKCTVFSLDTLQILEYEALWGWLDKKHKIVGPSSILFRPTKKPPVYVKEDLVRGIKVDVFQAEDAVDDVILNYYIMSKDWKRVNTISSVQLPIRVVAIGNTGIDTGGNDTITSFLNMTLDFLHFKPNLSSQLVFRIPTGIGCQGLRVPSDQTLPSIEEQYSFVVERYDINEEDNNVQTSITLNKIWFDSLNGLVRIDSSDGMKIEDYNTGVAYAILKNDTCSIGPILNSAAEKTNSLVGAMKDPKSLIQLDGYYYYIGRDIYRGVFCEIWETIRYNTTGLPTCMIYTYYFMVSKIEAITEGDRNFQSPVALVITGYNDNSKVPDLHQVYNYFDFDQSSGRLFNEIMSVGRCFPAPNQKIKLTILFEPDHPQNVSREFLSDYFFSLEAQALLEIASGASVSIIRFPFYELTWENTGLRAVFELTDRPHILAGFYNEFKGIRPGVNMQRVKVVESKEECAKQCLESSQPICNSFLICENECYVGEYDGTTEWEDSRRGKNNCDLFVRSVKASPSNNLDLELKDAVVTLQKSIVDGRLVIEAQDSSGNTTVDFVATKMDEIRFAPASVEFELVADLRQITKSDLTIELELDNDITLEGCHKHCKLDSRMSCNSFSFCPTTKVCRISSFYLTSQTKTASNETELSTQCSVFRVTPLALFDETPGRVPLFNGDLTINDVENEVQCAQKCQNEDSFKCRGFEYCQGSKSCELHKVHVLDMEVTAAAGANCIHYSKKYSSEFTNFGHILIKDPRSITLHYVPFEECARRCYLRPPSSRCRSFNFDAEPGLDGEAVLSGCSLNTLSIHDFGVQSEPSNKYSLYINPELEPLGPETTTPRPTGQPTYYPIKDTFLAGKYQVTSEYTRKTENVTFFVNEYHNIIKKESRMDINYADIENTDSYFFFSETQQVAIIRDHKCLVLTMKQALSPRAGLEWGWLDMKRLIVGPSSILWRDSYDTPQFIEKTSVRGKLCNVFSARDKLDKGVEITYYVPENDWETASGNNYEFPARVRVKGSYASGNETLEIDNQYDFVYFTSQFISDKNNMMLTKGLGCKNLQSRDARAIPKLEPMYSFVAEKYNSLDAEVGIESYIDLERIWYDEDTGIVMTEYHNRDHTKVKEANDYNTGVSYTFANEKCTIGPIRLSDSFVRDGRSQPANAIKTAQEFLEMDGTYYYLGDEFWRGIKCEVWESIKENVESDNVTYNRVVHTIYLTTADYVTAREGMLDARIPVRILLNIQAIENGQGFQVEYNVFNYDDYRTKVDMKMDIPIEQCFLKPEERQYFTIYYQIPNPDKTTVNDPKYGLDSDFNNLIASAANISTLRVSTTELVKIGDQILVNGLIVEKSPLMAQFYKYQKDVPALRQTVKISGLKDLEACASFCLNQNHIKNCKSITFCKTGSVPDCFVSHEDAYDVRNVTAVPDDNLNCQLYIRGSLNISDFGIPLTTALENLFKNKDQIELSISAFPKWLNLLPTKIEVKDSPFLVNKGYELLKTKTQLATGSNGKSVVVITKPTGSAEECYAECVKNTMTACSSFSYCNNGDENCRITSIYFKSEFDSNPQIDKDQTEHNTECNLYIRKAIQFFDETRGKMPSIKGNRVLPEIKTSDECAVACKNEQKFKCEGLEYCQASHTCVLHDTHALDISESSMVSKPEFCTHYSLSYAYEFENVGELELVDPLATVIRSVSFQECARLCKTTPGINCRSINFCEGKDNSIPVVECVLNTKTITDAHITKDKDRKCHHYTFTGIERITNDTTPTEQPDTIESVFPDVKELFFQGYEVESEINNRKLSKIYTVYEYHDLKNKRGRFDSSFGVNRTSEYYTPDFTKAVKFQDGKCTVGSPGEDDWGWWDSTKMILGPSAMLFRDLNENPSYNGQNVIRGILCNQFTARDKTDVGVTLNFYFSATIWSPSTGQPLPIPVRLTAKGKYSRPSLLLPIEIDTRVDFVGFQPKERRDDVFMIPKGVGCDGLMEPHKIPPIPTQISYSQEIYFSRENEPQMSASQVMHSKNYYNFPSKLYKTEGIEEDSEYWEVMDFNIGVTYQMKRGQCVGIQPISSVLFNDDVKGVVKSMKTTEEFLGLDGDFYYLGREYYRGVSCNVWESVKKNFFFMGSLNERAVVTAYFMSPTFLPTTDGHSNTQVPILIIYNTWMSEKFTKDYKTWKLNLFEFDQGNKTDFYKEMDIEPCVEQDQKIHFLIYFSSNNTISSTAEINDKEFRDHTILTTAWAASVNHLRIKLENVNYNNNNIAVRGMIFGRPPFRRGFIFYDNEPATNDQKRMDMISDPEICAQKCLEESSFFCKGYTICNNNLAKSACFLTSKDKNNKDWGGTVPEYENCQLYFRTTADSKMDEVSLEMAMANLNDKISQRKFEIVIDKLRIRANRLEERVTPIGFDDDINYEDVFENRKLSKDSHTTIDLGSDSAGSTIECYDQCVQESRLECVSFSFCKADRSCRVSSVFVVGSQNSSGLEELEQGKATSCGVYRRNAIKLFDELPGRPNLGAGDKVLTTASPEECALRCKKESEFKCLGFEFCDQSSGCVLHKTHLLDLPITSKKAQICTYYAAKYSAEFADLGRFVLIEPKSSFEKGVTFEQCAKLCVDARDECRSINYCPDMRSLSKSRCDLNTLSDQDEGAILVEAQTCSYYFKRNLKDRIPLPEQSEPEKLVSSGKFTGIAFILIFVGIGLGVAGYVGAAWYKRKRQNPANVRFVDSTELTESTSQD